MSPWFVRSYRANRGGYWGGGRPYACTTYHIADNSSYRFRNLGFRLLRRAP